MRDLQAVVVGTGMMGPGIAAVFALGGIPTHLVSRTRNGANEGILKTHQLIGQLQANGLAEPEQAQLARSLLTGSSDLEKSLKSARWVVESIPENLELKQEFFRNLDQLTDRRTVLASNTSGISITAIAAKTNAPERILTTHFWNPPHLMPLVEVVMGSQTTEAVATATVDLLSRCGKTAVLVRKDRPGQLGNRLQHALVREAVNVVQEGIASPEDVDLAIKTGFGLRLPVWGVFEHIDAVGLDLVKAVQDYVLPDLNNQTHAGTLINQKVENGQLGSKAGQGFYDWTQHDLSAAQARRDSFLIQVLRDRKRQNKP